MRNKRGLSAVVTTLIIILLVIVAIAIVWVVISNVISQGAEEVSLGKFTVDAEISNVNIDNSTNNVSLSVKRKVGEGNISGIKFIFYTNTGSEIIEEEISMQELETIKFNFHLNTDVNQIIRISIVPLFKTKEGKKINGNIVATYNTGGGSSGGSSGSSCTANCSGRECGSDGCGGTCGSCSGSQYCSSGTCVTGTNPCDLSTAFWSNTSVVEGTLVTLNLTGTNCSGSDINFSIYEDDPLFDDYVESIVDTFDSTNWISFWTYSGDDDVGTDPRDYYFIASVLDNPSESVTSSDLSVSQLPTEYCGNNIIDGSDVCDGTDLGSETCVTQGYSSGTLSCLSDCTGFNFTSCVNETCTPDCSCASTTCTGSTCSDGCGGTCSGTLSPDCGSRECGAAPNGCGSANECGSCSGSESCVSGTCVTAMTCNNISQYGITWTFDTNYLCGQFVNGDWWVVGPVNINSVTHDPLRTEILDTRSQVNPRWNDQGYEPRSPVAYNSGSAISTPFTADQGDTVLSVNRITDAEMGNYDYHYLADAAVLTIVDTVQDSDKFRPPYVRPTRESVSANDNLIFSINNINWNLLPRLTPPSSVPTFEQVEDVCDRPWVDHISTSVGVEQMTPYFNTGGYGRDVSQDSSVASLMLLLDYTNQEKSQLLYNAMQIGIDYYGMVLDGGNWPGDAGLFNGRKWPIIFAGYMLNNSDIYGVNRMYNGVHRFSEDGQTTYYDDTSLPDYVYVTTWGEVYQTSDPNYSGSDLAIGPFPVRNELGKVDVTNGGPGDHVVWRIREAANPEYNEQIYITNWSDDPDIHRKSEAYRVLASAAWNGYALSFMLLGQNAIDIWDHDEFFDYNIRWMNQDRTIFGALFEAKFSPYTYSTGFVTGSYETFVQEMWDTYGSNLTYLRAP